MEKLSEKEIKDYLHHVPEKDEILNEQLEALFGEASDGSVEAKVKVELIAHAIANNLDNHRVITLLLQWIEYEIMIIEIRSTNHKPFSNRMAYDNGRIEALKSVQMAVENFAKTMKSGKKINPNPMERW